MSNCQMINEKDGVRSMKPRDEKLWNTMNKRWSRVKKKVKINPCPLCGSRKIYLVSTTLSLFRKLNLECFEDECHWCGPRGLTMRSAVRKWNRDNGGKHDQN